MGARHAQRTAGIAGVALLLAVTVPAGCGGGGKPSAAEQRAALDRWQDRADDACRKGNAKIAERGWPASLVDLDRLTVRAISDIRDASAAIQRLPAPEGAEKRVAPFVGSLKALEPLMARLSSTTEDFKAGKLEAFAPKLQSGLAAVEDESKRLGLRHCAANDEHVWVPDAIRAPVFAQQLAILDRRILKRAKAIGEPASTPSGASRNLDKLSDIVVFADRGLSRLKPPAWADAEAGRYVDALRDLGSALDAASTELAETTLTPAEASAAQAKLNRAIRTERKRFKRLYKEIGAIPVLPGGGGGEEESPAGDETQPA
jgi:hypothetical protein